MAQKKSFKDNPALQFISTQNTDDTAETYNTDNTYYTHDKHDTQNAPPNVGTERKSKRLNLLLQPSMLQDLAKIAYMKQTSVNDLINRVLKDYAKTETDALSRYDDIFSEKE